MNDAEMEDNGEYFAVRRRWCVGGGSSGTRVVVVVVAVFAVRRGNHRVGGVGGGLEELTVQDKCFFTAALISLVQLYLRSAKSHLHVSAVVMMAFCTV